MECLHVIIEKAPTSPRFLYSSSGDFFFFFKEDSKHAIEKRALHLPDANERSFASVGVLFYMSAAWEKGEGIDVLYAWGTGEGIEPLFQRKEGGKRCAQVP